MHFLNIFNKKQYTALRSFLLQVLVVVAVSFHVYENYASLHITTQDQSAVEPEKEESLFFRNRWAGDNFPR